MRLLFGVKGMGPMESKAFVDSANEIGAEIRSYETKFSKLGIEQYLEAHPDTDVVIVSERLESKSAYEVADFEKMIELNEALRIIPILSDDAFGSDKIKGIFNLGIYTALFSKDASADQVARMITDGRTRKAAKLYYNIPDTDGTPFGANIQQCVTFICEDGMPEGILERTQYVKEHVELSDYQLILSRLPDDVRNLIKDSGEELIGVVAKFTPDEKPVQEEMKNRAEQTPKANKIANEAVIFFKKTQSIFHGGIFSKADKGDSESENSMVVNPTRTVMSAEQLKELLINVTIAFVGTQKRIGCTYQAIIVAHYLFQAGYRVALADCTKTKGKTFDAIRKSMPVTTGKGFFSYNGVDYYSNMESDMADIFLSKERYNFIVVDFGTFDHTEKAAFAKSSIKCVVAGAMPWEIGALNSFTMEAKSVLRECNCIIRNTGIDNGAVEEILGSSVATVLYAKIQENPFCGDCYQPLKGIFDPYIANGEKLSLPKESPRKRRKNGGELSHGPKSGLKIEKKVKNIGTACVYVTSLKHGCGNTHFSSAAANYLSEKGQKVCVVSDACSMADVLDESIKRKKTTEVKDEMYAHSDYMIFDEGVYGELLGDQLTQCRRSDYKIMMCWADDDYMTRLADFVSKEGDEAERWIYMFNNVPDKKINEIKRVMNLYFTCFLPLFEADDPDKEVRKILKEVFS